MNAALNRLLLDGLPLFGGACAAVALLWLGLSGGILLARRRHDRLAAALAACGAARPRPGDGADAAAAAAWSLALRRRLDVLPRHMLYRLACDGAAPAWLKEAVAACARARYGARRLLREAAGRHWRRDPWRRVGALHLLYQLRAGGLHALLGMALAQPDRDVAAAAVTLLGALGDRPAAALLVRALRRDRQGRARVATQLDRFDDGIADLLLALLDDADAAVRLWSIRLLARHRALARLDARLAAHAGDADAAIRKAVVQALGELGGPLALAVATRLLADPVGYVRAHAARALGRLRQPPHAVGALLAPMLADRDWWARLAAREVLAAAGPAVWRDVAAQLQSSDAFARDGAHEVLRQIGMGDAAARPADADAGADGDADADADGTAPPALGRVLS